MQVPPSKTCVVTGASSGIGLALAEALAREGVRVVLIARDPARGDAALRAVWAAARGPAPSLIRADLAELAGVRAAAEQILAAWPRLDLLVHNAGVWPARRVLTPDGFETAFAVNHLAPFLLTDLLEARLRQSAPARVVQVTAGLYPLGRLDLARTPAGEDFHRLRTYASTKLWNLLATLERARALAGSGVMVNAVHPGVVRTRLGEQAGVVGFLLRVVKRFWLAPDVGARGPLKLCLDPGLAETTGSYFDRERPAPLHDIARDPVRAASVVQRTRALLDGP